MNIQHDLYLASAWWKAHRAFDATPNWTEFWSLRQAYNGRDRHYHGWQHIYECVQFANNQYGYQPLVIMALFYHDVVYDSTSKTNEVDSAERWKDYSRSRGFNLHSLIKSQQVYDMIIMTVDHKVKAGQPLMFSMMCDTDMSIMLSSSLRYVQYARDIWHEYQAVGKEQYKVGRLAFLTNLDPETMFYTHQAHDLRHFARSNIDLEKTILKDSPELIFG